MERRKFLQTTFGATSLVAAGLSASSAIPIQLLADGSQSWRDEKGFMVPAGEGRAHGHIRNKTNPTNTVDVKVSGKDTGGGLAIFEQIGLSAQIGVPLHLHDSQDEIFYVMEGAYVFQVGETRHRLKTGDTIFLPRQVPHAWTQVSERAKTTLVLQPAGKLEEFFVKLASLATVPTQDEIASIFKMHEMRIVGPRLTLE